jgi:hypothetical protein
MTSDVRCTLRVTATDGQSARVAVRNQQFSIGKPLEFDNASAHVSALEYALGAVAGEVVNGLRAFAWRRRVEIDAIEAVVTGELEHGLAYLEVIGEPGPPRIARIHVKVFVASPDAAAVQRVWADAIACLPLVCTWRAAVRLDLELIPT